MYVFFPLAVTELKTLQTRRTVFLSCFPPKSVACWGRDSRPFTEWALKRIHCEFVFNWRTKAPPRVFKDPQIISKSTEHMASVLNSPLVMSLVTSRCLLIWVTVVFTFTFDTQNQYIQSFLCSGWTLPPSSVCCENTSCTLGSGY